jgi:TolA-binding protein
MSLLLAFISSGCGVYFNTFFNANKSFKQAEKTRKGNLAGSGGDADYKLAIEKTQKIVENFPKSSYYDDALYILAVSLYRTKQFNRAERRFRDLQEQFPDGKYANRIPLFLAQTKRELNEIDSAIVLFKRVASTSIDKTERAEASLELGRYYSKEKKPIEARPYLLAVRDSVGNDTQREQAQGLLADGYLASFDPNNALDAYLDIAKTSKDPEGKFRAQRKAIESAYLVRQVEFGQSILNDLIRDKANYDSAGVLRLKLAEGYEIDEEPVLAKEIYRDLAKDENKLIAAEANYRLGMMSQFDENDLISAKTYYEATVKLAPNSAPGQQSTKRSSDITKLQQMNKQIVLDSTASPEKINKAAKDAYDLAELFWTQFNQADSAVNELTWIIDSLPRADLAPNAMLFRAGIFRETTADSILVDSLLREVIERFPYSSSAEQARIVLGMTRATPDTLTPQYYVQQAESLYIDEADVVAAGAAYQEIVTRFPGSKEAIAAEFAMIWLTDQYASPGDSSLVYAYQEYLDSFPQSDKANWIRTQLAENLRTGQSRNEEERNQPTRVPSTDSLRSQLADEPFGEKEEGLGQGSRNVSDLEASLYVSIEGDTIIELTFPPEEFKKDFEFPVEAYVEGIREYILGFHLLLDFSGRVIKDSLRAPSAIDELNRRAEEVIETATFNATRVATEIQRGNVKPSKIDESSYWVLYRWKIVVPPR